MVPQVQLGRPAQQAGYSPFQADRQIRRRLQEHRPDVPAREHSRDDANYEHAIFCDEAEEPLRELHVHIQAEQREHIDICRWKDP